VSVLADEPIRDRLDDEGRAVEHGCPLVVRMPAGYGYGVRVASA
jgi:hypothetical protein